MLEDCFGIQGGYEEQTTLLLREKKQIKNSLAVQWLGLCASTAEGRDSIPSQGTKILHATKCGQIHK